MNLDNTTITLIAIATAISLYLIYASRKQNGAVPNSGSLDAESVSDDTYDGSSMSSSGTISTGSASSGPAYQTVNYSHSSYLQGQRGGNSNGLTEYFDNDILSGNNVSGEVIGLDDDVKPEGTTTSNGDFKGLNSSGNDYALFQSDGKPSNEFDAGELLPQDSADANNWFDTYNNVNAKVKNNHLINIYRPLGVNTVAGTLRNASLDIRGEEANPKFKVGPWLNSTIDPDIYNMGLCN